MSQSYELRNHLEWLGYVQPVGLVVSAPAMLAAECMINRNMSPIHRRFLTALPLDENEDPTPVIPCFATFTQNVLDWRESDLLEFPTDTDVDASHEMGELQVFLESYSETLRPTHAVPVNNPDEGQSPWAMLVQEHDHEIDLDEDSAKDTRGWQASPHLKFERLLRETNVPAGIITNGKQIRLVYAPKGETSGYITFEVEQMTTVAGRPIFAAFHMLLCEERMFSVEPRKQLPAILADSRKYQNTVSTQLAQQVMAALFELLRGFQAADDQRGGDLLRQILANEPNHVYHGLLTVLMRMVFILYAEDRGLISSDPVYSNHYSITGLFERLRSDDGRYPDTMDQRYGAWAQLLTLFRLIYSGGQHDNLKIPSRDGYLFDPNRYPFLEGRFDDNDVNVYSDPERRSSINVPRVSDGVIFRVLHNLLVLDGERLSYRALDVEQIGSVYEAIMGFELEVAQGRSIAVKPVKKHGAPATINLESLLDAKSADRAKLLKEWSDQKLTGAALKELKSADSIEGILSALDKKIAKDVTPNIVPTGAMVFQPSDERRRSGSHYTPRSLTEPIVRTTLEPILKQLTTSPSQPEEPDAGSDPKLTPNAYPLTTTWQPTPADKKRYTKGEIAARIAASQRRVGRHAAACEIGIPHPTQILDLKICDPAMGSGAFLVEVCRQLADQLVISWHAHSKDPDSPTFYPVPPIPPDEDELLYARRLVAQRCLYGVDKNVMAVDLAKLSLWLVTLARDHAFTFLDHSLRHGDSLVGLTREQIIGFHWDRKKFKTLLNEPLQKRLDRATEARAKILNAREDVQYRDQEQRLKVADDAIGLIRVLGDACVSCFFAESKKKAREEEADRVYGLASSYLASIKGLGARKLGVSEDLAIDSLAPNSYPLATGVDFASRTGLQEAAKRLRDSSQEHPVPAFHWEIEFPEVFSRENGGFDAFVGNPPFAGMITLAHGSHECYTDFLRTKFEKTGGKADLVAFFFRRSFELMREKAVAGLIATNTIGQGDTRESGLSFICDNGGIVFRAMKRMRWPGTANVIVSTVNFTKCLDVEPKRIDGNVVSRVTAYLFHAGGNHDPAKLASPAVSSKGVVPYGMGFVLQDGKADSLPTSKYYELIEEDCKNAEVIKRFIGGEDFNSHPTQEPERFIINFGEMPEERAREWPAAFQVVVEMVKPTRMALTKQSGAKTLKQFWWQYAYHAKDMTTAKSKLEHILATAQTSKHRMFAFSSADNVFDQQVVVFANADIEFFCVMQSQPHLIWSDFFGSTMKDDSRYFPSDCFETFPFPSDFEQSTELAKRGSEYYDFRLNLMNQAEEGLTKTYNRFHSPEEVDEGILELRRLHGLMDGAVLRAYGWDDLAESAAKSGFCEFLLDYEEEEDELGVSGQELGVRKKSKKKKPWRYRWPDDFRDEVLARLLELNEQRHREEQLMGQAAQKQANSKKKTTNKKPTESTHKKENAESSQSELF